MFKFFSRKRIIISVIIATILLIILSISAYGMTHYQTVDFSTGLVTATTLNVRQGPSTTYKVVTQVYKNEYVRVFAKIGDWYVIQTDGDFIGAVSSKYVKAIYPNSTPQGNTVKPTDTTKELTADEEEVFYLINQKRIEAGLQALVVDKELQRVARIKAQDMVDNSYFSHTSAIYGSPFDMIKNFGISYKTAGENIAGNSTNTGAVNAWMGSEGHKANILSNSYNYTGIGVVNSPRYGKIYVQMFIGR